MNAAASLCSDKDCGVQVDGKCRLNHDPVESCPNYGGGKEAVDNSVVDEASRTLSPVGIWSSDVMHLDDLARFMRRRRVRNVALVGEHKVGKTTLLASIYEIYCKGAFAGLTFAGSETLLAFARLHSFALLSSGRSSPIVPRTSRNDPVGFFHLALARARGDIVDVVIADRSGETYTAARTNTDLIQTLDELHLADRVCFLLDGGRLTSKDLRTSYTRQFRQMINALYDNGALADVRDLEVLSTKFDITSSSQDDEQIKFLDEYEARIAADFATKGLNISCHRICALPKADRSIGFVGLDSMIRRWTTPDPLPDVTPQPADGAQRQFDRLLSKV